MKFMGREVDVIEIDGTIGEGAWATEAVWLDTLKELTERELEKLSDDCQEELYDRLYQDKVCEAEAWADAMEDR